MARFNSGASEVVADYVFSGAPSYQELSAELHRCPEAEMDDSTAVLNRLGRIAPIAASFVVTSPPSEQNSPAPSDVREAWRGIGLPVRTRIEMFRYVGIHAVDAIYMLENQSCSEEWRNEICVEAAIWWGEYFRKTVAEEQGLSPERALNTGFLVFPTSDGVLTPISEKWFLRQQSPADSTEL